MCDHTFLISHPSPFHWWARGPCLPAVQPPVPAALQRFTTRFGMGRGGSTALNTRLWFKSEGQMCLALHSLSLRHISLLILVRLFPLAPPPRSWQVKEALVHAHWLPPHLAVLPVPAAYPGNLPGDLPGYTREMSLFGCISHLDAVSGSCCRP